MDTDDKKLTDKQIDAISKAMDEVKEDSEDLKFIADLPSNKEQKVIYDGTVWTEDDGEIPEYETTTYSSGEPVVINMSDRQGYTETTTMTINPNTGEHMPTATPEEKNESEMTFDELVERASNNLDNEVVEITEEDIEKEIKNNDDILNDFEISREGIVQVLRVVQRVQNKEEFNIFKELPTEVQERINQYVLGAGYGYNTTEFRTLRNTLSEMLINEFISNISLDKYTMDFQKEMNSLQNKVNEEFSKMYMDYDQNRTKYVEAIMEQQEDPAKREAIGAILDAINDGFKLERIKVAAATHKIKIKKFELEKPQKVFNDFLWKYKDSTQNIYSVYTSYNTLYRHMKDEVEDPDDILRFFIAICKFCRNYHSDNPVEHAFMYYSMYNPILLDVYKGEEYESFAPAYKANVKEVVDLLKTRPTEAENNKKQKKNKK